MVGKKNKPGARRASSNLKTCHWDGLGFLRSYSCQTKLWGIGEQWGPLNPLRSSCHY